MLLLRFWLSESTGPLLIKILSWLLRLSNADFLEFELDFLYVSEPEDSSSKKRLA